MLQRLCKAAKNDWRGESLAQAHFTKLGFLRIRMDHVHKPHSLLKA